MRTNLITKRVFVIIHYNSSTVSFLINATIPLESNSVLVPFPKRPFPMSFWLRWNESRMNMLYSTSQKNFLWKKNKKKEGKCEKQKQKNVVSVRENFRTYFISICGDASSVNWWYAVFCWTVVCWVC